LDGVVSDGIRLDVPQKSIARERLGDAVVALVDGSREVGAFRDGGAYIGVVAVQIGVGPHQIGGHPLRHVIVIEEDPVLPIVKVLARAGIIFVRALADKAWPRRLAVALRPYGITKS